MCYTAQSKKVVPGAPTNSSRKTAAEIKEFQREERRKELYAKAKEAIQRQDITKTQRRTYTIYNKENLRTYMKNPMSNESRLRNFSRFLYRVSQPYRRLVNHLAQQIDLTALMISPNVDITQDIDKETVLKNYYDTCVQVDKMKLYSEIYKLLVTAWIEDSAYGYIYEDDTGFFKYPLDGDYCKVSSTNMDGSLNFAFDFSYFRSRQELLEYWDSEFEKKYNVYMKDSSQRWQELDSQRTICLKIGIDDPLLSLSPLSGLWEQLIDLIDTLSIATVKNELSIYKLLIARLEHMPDSQDPDDFQIDVDFALDYFNKMLDSIPAEVAAAISPMPIDTIEFDKNATDDTNMVAKSMSNLFKLSGSSMVLNDEKSGSSIYRANFIADMMTGLKPLLGEIETWVNRYLSYSIPEHGIVRYIETSPWMKNEKKSELLKSAQYGVPVKMAVGALDGLSPLEMLRMQYLENEVLAVQDKWIPLNSSFVQSGNSAKESGGQEKDILTTEGENTKESEKNKM